MVELITDRAYRDTQEAQDVISAMKAGTATPEQQAAFWKGLRGCWGKPDINRIQTAISQIVDRFVGNGMDISVVPLDTSGDQPITMLGINHLLNNIRTIIMRYHVYATTPAVPNMEEGQMTTAKANALERILVDVNALIDGQESMWQYAGTTEGGVEF